MTFLKNNHFTTNLLIGLFLLLAGSLSAQNVWFVSNSGQDSPTNGSISQPFKTITYASSFCNPGDTVKVRGGEYVNEHYQDGDIWKLEETVRIVNLDGTPEAYITFMPYNFEKVVLKGDGDNIVFIRNCSYIRFTGFEVEGEVENASLDSAFYYQFAYQYRNNPGTTYFRAPPNTPPEVIDTMTFVPITEPIIRPSLYNGFGITATICHHVEISRNKVHHTSGSGIRVLQSDYFSVLDNEVHNTTRRTSVGNHGLIVYTIISIDTVSSTKSYISRNLVHHNYNEVYSWSPSKTIIHPVLDEGKGISIQKSSYETGWKNGRVLIDNNLTYFNGFSGVHLNEVDRVDIFNNTSYMNSLTGQGNQIGISTQASDSCRVINNIVVADSSWGGFALLTTITGQNVFENNLVLGKIKSEVDAIDGNTTIFGNPQFIDTTRFDFRLKSNSPAIDQAWTQYTAPTDFFNKTRPASPDLGAMERQPETTAAGLSIEILPVNEVNMKWSVPADDTGAFYILEKTMDFIQWDTETSVSGNSSGLYLNPVSAADDGRYYYRITNFTPQLEKGYSNLAVIDNCKPGAVCSCFEIIPRVD